MALPANRFPLADTCTPGTKGLPLTAANPDRYNLRDGVVIQMGWCGEKKEK